MDKRIVVAIAGSSVVSAAIGAFAGYKVAVKRLTKIYDEELERQMKAAKAAYGRLAKPASPEEVLDRRVPGGNVTAEQAAAAQAMYQGEEVSDEVLQRIVTGLRVMSDQDEGTEELTDDEEVVVEESEMILGLREDKELIVKNLFEEGNFEETLQDELRRKRDRSRPYVITKEEFYENELFYDQTTVNFYEKCGSLADEKGLIADSDAAVGDNNMNSFGIGSGQPHIVLIRNEILQMDFEVCRNTGSYAQYLGMDDTPKWVPKQRRSGRGADE